MKYVSDRNATNCLMIALTWQFYSDQVMHDEIDLRQALGLMQSALSLIDKADAAHDAGAHLDLAICRLSELLAGDPMRDKDDVRNEQTH